MATTEAIEHEIIEKTKEELQREIRGLIVAASKAAKSGNKSELIKLLALAMARANQL
jgi:hypothetical protein